MIFCLKDMLRKAEQHGLDDFKALVDQAKGKALVVQLVDFDWRQNQQSGPATGPTPRPSMTLPVVSPRGGL